MCPGPGERLSEELQRCIVPEQEEDELEGPLDDDIGITEPTPLEEESNGEFRSQLGERKNHQTDQFKWPPYTRLNMISLESPASPRRN